MLGEKGGPARRPPIRHVPRGVGVGERHTEAGVHLLPGRVGARGRTDERRGQGEVACEKPSTGKMRGSG